MRENSSMIPASRWRTAGHEVPLERAYRHAYRRALRTAGAAWPSVQSPAGKALTSLSAGPLVAFAIAGCGSSASLDTRSLQQSIAASILAQHGLRAEVHCPQKVPRKAGVTFVCTAHPQVGSYPVSVTETNGSGHVRYGSSAPLVRLDTAKVERAIARSVLAQRHLRATVSCPSEVLQQQGLTFTCVATVRGRHYPFVVTQTNAQGHVRFEGR